MGMGNLQRMVMGMQQDMLRIQQELVDARVEGSAGGGVVGAVVNGKGDLVSVKIDVEMLQDLIVAAVTEAQREAHEMEQSKMSEATGGLRLPGM
jgi:DNA-binding protein YbaB